jgi:hypothetical protein
MKNIDKDMREVVLILMKQIIKISFNNILLYFLFYLYKKAILVCLQLANVSNTLSLKLIILSLVIFPHLRWPKQEEATVIVCSLKSLHSFQSRENLSGVA